MVESVGHVSVPSRLGRLMEELFDEYRIFELKIQEDFIDQFHLREELKSFSSQTLINEFKRRFFYSRTTSKLCRSQISHSSPLNLSFEQILLDNSSSSSFDRRFNFVLTNDRLIFVRIPRSRHVSFHLLCKHYILADGHKDVRFAGEFWKDEQEIIRVNNNSGTFQPENHRIQSMVKLFRHLAPTLSFQGLTFQSSQRRSNKQTD